MTYPLYLKTKAGVIKISFILLVLLFSVIAEAQDERAQLPNILSKSYFEVSIGSINYPFSKEHLEPGYIFQSVKIPHTAVRLVLIGYEFTKIISVRISYMRPVLWVKYGYSVDGDQATVTNSRTVWMNEAGLTLRRQFSFDNHFSMYTEGGLNIVTRHGFNDMSGPVVKNAKFATVILGGGLKYHVNEHWGLMLSAAISPANRKEKQPYTSIFSTGFCYKFLPFSEKQIEKTAKTGYIYPKQMIQIGFTSNILGYGVNNFVSQGIIPVFWGGEAEVHHGLSINYQRNVFHGAKVFSLDWGANVSYWQSNVNKDNFFTLSLFPVFRLTFYHSKPADAYFYYSVAGPSYISKIVIDGHEMGAHFTFQDNMGAGVFFGEHRNFNAEIKIGHYSNGNISTQNEAVKIPLTLNLGYTF